MSKFFMLIIGMSILSNALLAQVNATLKGQVFDDQNRPLTGATVWLSPNNWSGITDATGNFAIDNIPVGYYKVQISFIGYSTHTDSIRISGLTNLNVNLELASLSLQEVVISDVSVHSRHGEESLNIEIVNDEYLKQNMGGSLMNSLERLPGVSTIEIGSGQSKPVIRGLGFNRVVVVENNIKHEAQQWGADHGLEIDQYAIENIEVLKGPASLMYGSDAIGGVIDMKAAKAPRENTYGGTIDLSGKTNNGFFGSSMAAYVRKNGFFVNFRATILDYGDYKVPTDSVDIYSYRAALHKNYLRNTAGKEHNYHLSFGLIQEKFQSLFYVSNVSNRNGFFANAHGLEPRAIDTDLHDKSNRDIHYPYQKANHFKITNTSRYQWDKLDMEANLGFQRNFRQEWSQYVDHGHMPPVFPDTLDFNSDLEREFDKDIYSGKLNFNYRYNNRLDLIAGLSGEYQNNQIDGRGFIIPAYTQANAGAFVLGKYELSKHSKLQLGVRYDYGEINTQAYMDWFASPVIENGDTSLHYLQRAAEINRSFNNFSWALGYNYEKGKWAVKSNVGKSFRMPIAKELAANGVNYHRFSYEVGNPDLSPEVSWQWDIGAEYASRKFALGATPFINYFSNYIYLNPTSEHDRLYGNGNQVYYYTESAVLRYGMELHGHYEIYRSLQLGIIGEYVYAEQLSGEKQGYTLPFSPPPAAIFNIKYKQARNTRLLAGSLSNAYVSMDYRITAAQNNIVPPEVATPGNQVFNLGLGGDFNFQKQKIKLSLQVQNLFNKKYFNHTSYYRLINVPEPGRNFIVNISLPFSGAIKNKKVNNN